MKKILEYKPEQTFRIYDLYLTFTFIKCRRMDSCSIENLISEFDLNSPDWVSRESKNNRLGDIINDLPGRRNTFVKREELEKKVRQLDEEKQKIEELHEERMKELQKIYVVWNKWYGES
mgnify:CR=1 FL=1